MFYFTLLCLFSFFDGLFLKEIYLYYEAFSLNESSLAFWLIFLSVFKGWRTLLEEESLLLVGLTLQLLTFSSNELPWHSYVLHKMESYLLNDSANIFIRISGIYFSLYLILTCLTISNASLYWFSPTNRPFFRHSFAVSIISSSINDIYSCSTLSL